MIEMFLTGLVAGFGIGVLTINALNGSVEPKQPNMSRRARRKVRRTR